jgi:branched-chain amino acid transport system substrate-binding protein
LTAKATPKFKSDKADIIVLAAWPNELGLFARQAREAGLKAAIISPDTGMIDVVAQIAGKTIDGLMFTYTPDYKNDPGAKTLAEEYRAKHIDPSGFTVFPYAMIQTYAQAITQVGSTDAEKVAAALRHNKFHTVIGDIGFDDKGNLTGVKPVIYRYEGTIYKPLAAK